jgi:hypothetical protein
MPKGIRIEYQRGEDEMANTRSHVVTIKFTPDEFEMLQAGAAAARTTQSEYLRGCLLRDRLMDRDPVAKKIAHARLGGMFRGSDVELEAWVDDMLKPARDLELHMEVGREQRKAKKK